MTDVARLAAIGIPATTFGSGDPEIAHTKDEHLQRRARLSAPGRPSTTSSPPDALPGGPNLGSCSSRKANCRH
ncbi:MAG: hypothetical protein R2710_13060 [Acidimicrobiales bacterium]